jgi:hypothetical protein
MAFPRAEIFAKATIALIGSWQNCAKYSLEKYIFSPLAGAFIGRISALLRNVRHQPGKSAGRSRIG